MDKIVAFVKAEKKWIVALVVGLAAGAGAAGYHVPSAVVDFAVQAVGSL
jgi:hypothetical protein